MKIITFSFLLLAILTSVSATTSKSYLPPAFDLKKCSYDVNREWTKVTMGTTGGTPPLDFYFD